MTQVRGMSGVLVLGVVVLLAGACSGSEAMARGLRTYVERYAFGHPTGLDLALVLGEAAVLSRGGSAMGLAVRSSKPPATLPTPPNCGAAAATAASMSAPMANGPTPKALPNGASAEVTPPYV